jgi:hypothetical protein
MGLLAAIDASAKGQLGKDKIKWAVKGFQGGFSSPVIDGARIYQIDNGANLFAFDSGTGKQLWTINLGTIQKSSPVLADGKLYVGTENGKFFILKPGAEGCEILDEDQLGAAGAPEAIIASVAVNKGRIYLVSDSAIYCIGKKAAPAATSTRVEENASADTAATHVQVIPSDVTLKPGETARFRVRLFDDRGRFIREEQRQVAWSLDRLAGNLANGAFTAAPDRASQVGAVKAAVGSATGIARVRVLPGPAWGDDFESYDVNAVPPHWINTAGKYAIREIEGNKVLVKNPEPPIFKRGRAFIGPSDLANYTIQADVFSTEKRRQMGDAGVIGQRYSLVLYGNHQRLAIEPWQPETERTAKAPFSWKSNTWYRVKLQVENMPGGRVRARGKAWPANEAEPAAWNVERIDPIGNRQGSPGVYADASVEIFFDNLKVTANK